MNLALPRLMPLALLALLLQAACGVKAPPLPPLPDTPQQSEAPAPRASTQPSSSKGSR